MAAENYKWSQEKCLAFGLQIEAEIAEQDIDVAEHSSFAVRMVTDGINLRLTSCLKSRRSEK